VLAFGPNVTTRSDFRVFTADGGSLIKQMAASNDVFLSTCQTLVERMVNTVPREVALTDVITPIRVKPEVQGMEVRSDGTIAIIGRIRVGHSPLRLFSTFKLICPLLSFRYLMMGLPPETAPWLCT